LQPAKLINLILQITINHKLRDAAAAKVIRNVTSLLCHIVFDEVPSSQIVLLFAVCQKVLAYSYPIVNCMIVQRVGASFTTHYLTQG